MPLRTRPHRSRHAPSAALLAAALMAGTVSCGSPAASTGTPGCVVLSGLREEMVGEVTTSWAGTAPREGSPAIGDGAAYVRRLRNAATGLTATVYGTSHVRTHMANGHLLGYVDERIEFDEGTVQAQGLYDLTAAEAGASQYVPVIGLTGSFRDKMGRHTFRAAGASGNLRGAIDMCPAGMLK